MAKALRNNRVSRALRVGTRVLAALLVLGVTAVQSPRVASSAPVGFDPARVVSEYVGGGMELPLAADWVSASRMLVLGKSGEISVVDTVNGGSTKIYTIPDLYDAGEAGSLDLVVDPQVATNRSFYVYYSAANSRLRIGKFVLNSAINPASVVSNTTVWSNPGVLPLTYFAADTQLYHIGGALDIGPDGRFYLSIGDLIQGLSRDLDTVYGKVLRINSDGTVPTDNPFFDGDGPNADEIFALGMRNPFRLAWDRTRTIANPVGTPSAHLWVADVGGNVDATAAEEVNLVAAGQDFGWPACEGPTNPLMNPGPPCPSGVTGPVHYYPHTNGDGCCFNKSITGGGIYHGTNFPLDGIYVYSDYATGEFTWLQLAPDGRTKLESGLISLQPSGVVWTEAGPDGYIYFINLFTGEIRRLRYTAIAGNLPPVVGPITASPERGSAPLNTNFSTTATDAGNDPITYLWHFGDGTTSTAPSPSHSYTTAGVYLARLAVTAGAHTVLSDALPITVGSSPIVRITDPAMHTTFVAGQAITISGTATDALDGPLTGASLEWTVLFGHNQHTHPVTTGTGDSIVLNVPVTGHSFAGDTGYTVQLRAVNSFGLSSTSTIELDPIRVTRIISANVPTTGVIDDITQNLPFQLDTISGFSTPVSVPESVCLAGTLRTFSSWSDGGARTHVSTGAANTLSATYEDSGRLCSGGIAPLLSSRYVGVTPERVYDSRRQGVERPAGSTTVVQVAGLANVPLTGVAAVVLNITATQSAGAGFVTAYPAGSAQPVTSSLNMDHVNATTPNLVTVPLGANGAVALYSSVGTHLIVDVSGYYETVTTTVNSGRFVALTPDRLTDTRNGTKPAAGQRLAVPVAARSGVPTTGVSSVVLNVTAVDANDGGFVTVWPDGTSTPNVSNLNVERAGDVRANQVIVGLGTNGAVQLFTSSGTHILIDVVGYFTNESSASALTGLFRTAGPGRVLDTRGGPTPAAGTTLSSTVTGQWGVPTSGVAAIAANVTAVRTSGAGFVTAWANQTPRPGTSNLNITNADQTVPNHAIINVGSQGGVSLYTSGGTDLLLDVFGWYLS